MVVIERKQDLWGDGWIGIMEQCIGSFLGVQIYLKQTIIQVMKESFDTSSAVTLIIPILMLTRINRQISQVKPIPLIKFITIISNCTLDERTPVCEFQKKYFIFFFFACIIIQVYSLTMDQSSTQQSSIIAASMNQDEEDPTTEMLSLMLFDAYVKEAKKHGCDPHFGQEFDKKLDVARQKCFRMVALYQVPSQPIPPLFVSLQQKKEAELQRPTLKRHTDKLRKRRMSFQSREDVQADIRHRMKEVEKKIGKREEEWRNWRDNPLPQAQEIKRESGSIQNLSPIEQKHRWYDLSKSSKRQLLYQGPIIEQELRLTSVKNTQDKKEPQNVSGESKYATPVKKDKKKWKKKARNKTPPLQPSKGIQARNVPVGSRAVPLPVPKPRHRQPSAQPRPINGSRPNLIPKPRNQSRPKPHIGSKNTLPPKPRNEIRISADSKPRSGSRGKSK